MEEKITLAICTHNRHSYLADALISLKKVKYPKFEILVVDSSDSKLPKNRQKLCQRYIHVPEHKSLSAKRNIAIKTVKTGIIIFTDDDCIATPMWIEELTKPLSEKAVMCVTGRTMPFRGYEGTDYEKKFSFDKLGARNKIIRRHFGFQNLWRFGHGNNMAFLVSVFRKVGLFDVNLGVGSKGLRAEDVDMFYRIYKSGYFIIYNPDAVILHKHLVKKEGMEKAAYENGYASKLVLLKNLDLNTILLYFGGIIKLSFKALFSEGFEKKVNLNLIRGWLGIK